MKKDNWRNCEIGKLVELTAGSCLSADNVNSPHQHLRPLWSSQMIKDREILSTWELSLWLFFSLFGIFSFSWSRSSFSFCSWAISDSCSPSSSAHSTSVCSNQQNNCGIYVFYAAQQSCWVINQVKIWISLKDGKFNKALGASLTCLLNFHRYQEVRSSDYS